MEIMRAVSGAARFRRMLEVADAATRAMPATLAYMYIGGGRYEVLTEDSLEPVAVCGSRRVEENIDLEGERNERLAVFFSTFNPAQVLAVLAYLRDTARVWQQFVTTSWQRTEEVEEVLREVLHTPGVAALLRESEETAHLLDRGLRVLREPPEPPQPVSLDDPGYIPRATESAPAIDPRVTVDDRTLTLHGQPLLLDEGVEVDVRRSDGGVERMMVMEIRRRPDGTVVFGIATGMFDVTRRWVTREDFLSDSPPPNSHKESK